MILEACQEYVCKLMNKYPWQFVLYLWLYFLICYLFTGEEQIEDGKKVENTETKKDDSKFDRVKRAAVTAISAAAVKAKLLANQEEDQIRQLAAFLIEKQVNLITKQALISLLIVDFGSLNLCMVFPFVAVA